MVRQVYEDGSWNDIDYLGRVTATSVDGTTRTYYPDGTVGVSSGGGSVLDQFLQSALGGLSTAFNKAVNPPTRTTTSTGPKPAISMGKVLFVVGMVLIVPKLIKD